SSSDEKLERAKALGAFGTVNYRENPEWQRTVRELTGGAGVKHVLEVGGEDTLPKAVQALGYDGHIALIGGLSGFASSLPVGALMTLGGRVTGIYVGSRADFEALNAFIAEHGIEPHVDRVFELEDAPAAFDLMGDGDFMGKIRIRLCARRSTSGGGATVKARTPGARIRPLCSSGGSAPSPKVRRSTSRAAPAATRSISRPPGASSTAWTSRRRRSSVRAAARPSRGSTRGSSKRTSSRIRIGSCRPVRTRSSSS